MNIQTVAENLRNTIAGKEKYLDSLRQGLKADLTDGAYMAVQATAQMLEINIDELKRILKDVESCIAKDVEQSWRENPDRSGGQFTQEEIDNANRW
jgi:flagellar biosynthesis chaperone FliJ